MYTKELLPIVKEFRGKKSVIRLHSGDTLYGVVGELLSGHPGTATEGAKVSLLDEMNNKISLHLSAIRALGLL